MSRGKKPRKPKKVAKTTQTVCRDCGLIQSTEKIEFRRAALPRCVKCGGGLDKIGFASRLRTDRAANGTLPPDAPEWNRDDKTSPKPPKPAKRPPKREVPDSNIAYERGTVPYGKRSGQRLATLTLEQLAGLHSIALDRGPVKFVDDLRCEMEQRRRGRGPTRAA